MMSVELLFNWAKAVREDVDKVRLRQLIEQNEDSFLQILEKIVSEISSENEHSEDSNTNMNHSEDQNLEHSDSPSENQPENSVPKNADDLADTALSENEHSEDSNIENQSSEHSDSPSQHQPENQVSSQTGNVAETMLSEHQNSENTTDYMIESPAKMPPKVIPTHLPKLPQLPNAKQGEPYRKVLHHHHTQPESVEFIKNIEFNPECGLYWSAQEKAIMGTPNISGDIEIKIQLADSSGNNFTPQRQTIFINPDPRTLWKTLPHDVNAPFVKDDARDDFADTPFAHLLAARVRGRSHAHVGGFCDDDFMLSYHEASRVHILAVSDGAGSAKFSRYGSQLAVQTAVNTILSQLDDLPNHQKLPETNDEKAAAIMQNMLKNAVYQAYMAHVDAVQKDEHIGDVKMLSATLLVAMALPLADGRWLTGVYWVGDGAVALWQPHSGSVHLLGESDGGMYSGETRFLSAQEISEEAFAKRIRVVPGEPAVLLLMSDGVSDPKFDTEANLAKAEYWADLWQDLHRSVLSHVQWGEALKEWLGFWSVGNHDDRTLAMLLPKELSSDFRQPETESELKNE